MKLMLSRWIEARPSLGILTSFTGFGTAVLALMQYLSIFLGFLGAILGLVAGYYTLRIKREHWKRVQQTLSPARQVQNAAIIAARKAHTEALDVANETENQAVAAASKVAKAAAVAAKAEQPL